MWVVVIVLGNTGIVIRRIPLKRGWCLGESSLLSANWPLLVVPLQRNPFNDYPGSKVRSSLVLGWAE